MSSRRSLWIALVVLFAGLTRAVAAQQTVTDRAADPFQWLEDAHGTRSMAWVNAENAKTTAVLENDPRFSRMYHDALAVVEAKDRLTFANFIGGMLYNFWQDSAHTRGIWRRTTVASYRLHRPVWTTVLDLDRLANAEHANWVWEGADCELVSARRCVVSLSDGGEDAVTMREFDLVTRSFVKNGFVLPHGKQRAAWLTMDTLLVTREWTPGELTAAGYPFITKRVARGQPLTAGVEVFRGAATDGGYGVSPGTLHDGAGHQFVAIDRPLSTFEAEHYALTPHGPIRLPLPLKSSVTEFVDNQLIVQLGEDWTVGATHLRSGSLVSIAADAVTDPARLAPRLLLEPGPRESIGNVSSTRDRLLVTMYQNVKGRVLTFARAADGGWTKHALSFPDNLSIGVMTTDIHSDRAYVDVTGFLTPTSIWSVDTKSASTASIKTLPAHFDVSHDVVEQFEVASKDGTMIPYFVVHPTAMQRDGSNPTILYAYGGFEVSETPYYSETMGKLWLERGGVFVLANIRGGGEFGPAWHEAGLKTHRQVIYDDFAAVANDLIARGITSTPHLGIQGGSNGGLLMGVEFTQHPELWSAVDIQVPLLDMLRYEQIAAGASWVGEYGSVSVPAERDFLASISPYANLKPGVKYPEPFIWSTTKDDRVGPQHARKFAARLSAMGKPYLFYEVIEGGHGAGANLKERAHTSALELTYFARKLMGPPAT